MVCVGLCWLAITFGLADLYWSKVVEFDLRSSKMMHGSKALERIVWSFTEVLTGPVTFLFCDLNQCMSPTFSLFIYLLN